MCVHLVVNASVMNNAETFQNSVYQIHLLDKALPLVEWAFIFAPILFHALFGVVIIYGGLPNTSRYKYGANWRYTLQRTTGVIALLFIFWHVFHMHGWFHTDWWLENVAKPLGGAAFSPFNAASTLKEAMANPIVKAIYAVGVLSCVYHLTNGIWSMGITWGVWTTPKSQAGALKVCGLLGVALAAVSMSGLYGAGASATAEGETDVEAIRAVENRMYDARVEAGAISPNEHKRYHSEESGHTEEAGRPDATGHDEGEPADGDSEDQE